MYWTREEELSDRPTVSQRKEEDEVWFVPTSFGFHHCSHPCQSGEPRSGHMSLHSRYGNDKCADDSMWHMEIQNTTTNRLLTHTHAHTHCACEALLDMITLDNTNKSNAVMHKITCTNKELYSMYSTRLNGGHPNTSTDSTTTIIPRDISTTKSKINFIQWDSTKARATVMSPSGAVCVTWFGQLQLSPSLPCLTLTVINSGSLNGNLRWDSFLWKLPVGTSSQKQLTGSPTGILGQTYYWLLPAEWLTSGNFNCH